MSRGLEVPEVDGTLHFFFRLVSLGGKFRGLVGAKTNMPQLLFDYFGKDLRQQLMKSRFIALWIWI